MSKSNDGRYPLRICVRANTTTIARLDAYARSKGVTRSEAIRRWANSLAPNKDETSAA